MKTYDFLLSGDFYIDIGAHKGQKAEPIIQKGIRTLLVEPQPFYSKFLTEHYADRRDLVSIIEQGVGRAPGVLSLKINSKNPTLSTFNREWMTGRFKNEVWDSEVKVLVTTIDALVRRYGIPRYIKIDVEGFELDVLFGMTKRFGIVSFEFTIEFFENATKCLRYLAGLGYSKFNFCMGDQDQFALLDWVNIESLMTTIESCACRVPNLWGDIYAN